MKKTILSFTFVLLGTLVSKAQKVEYGLTAGLYTESVISRVKMDNSRYHKKDLGFFVGSNFDFLVSDKFHIQPSLLYAYVEEVNYLNIPLMFKYYVVERINLQGGPQLNINLNGLDKDSFQFNLGAGIGFDISKKVFIEGRYNYGLKDMSEIEGIKYRYDNLTIGLGFRF